MTARTSLATIAVLTGALLGAGCGSEFSATSNAAGTGGATTATASSSGGGGAGGDMSSAVSTSSATATSTSSAPAQEDCTNGVDDDGDTDADCADADCEPVTQCAPTAPDGWEGPIAYWEGLEGASAECPSVWPTAIGDQHTGTLFADPGSCVCSCGFGVGSSCPFQDTKTFSVTGCNVALSTAPLSGAPGCHDLNGSFLPVNSVKGSTALGSGGMCPPVLTSDFAEPSWELDAKLCGGASQGLGCDEGEVCVPRAPAPFGVPLCVFAGEEKKNCPVAYPVMHATYGGFVDGRGCADCQCGSPTVVCGGTTKLYTGGACGGNAAATVNHDGSCQDFGAGLTIGSYDNTIDISASCVPSAGIPTGSVTATVPITVCCTEG